MSSAELARRLSDVLKIPSCSSFEEQEHIGNRDVAQYLANWVQEDLEVKMVESPQSSKDVTLFLWPKGKAFPAKGNLALHTHLDSVPPGKLSLWTEGGPFEAKETNGWITGLGAADVKSDAVCKIAALLEFKNHDFKNSFPFFVGSFAEEIGMQGARWIHDSKVIQPDYALVGEPSDGYLSYANKGLGLLKAEIPFEAEDYSGKFFEIHYEGISGHSSSPHKAKNALEMALDDLPYQMERQTPIAEFRGSISPNVIPGSFSFRSDKKIIDRQALQILYEVRQRHREFQKKLTEFKNEIFDPASATSSWTILRNNEKSIQIGIEFRYLPGQDIEALISDFIGGAGEVYLDRSSPAAEARIDTDFARALASCQDRPKPWITKSGSNESYFYQALGAECFVHGPGISYGNIHRPNEKIAISSLEKAFQFYRKVIEKLCL